MIKNILRKIKYKLKNTFSMKIPVNNPILYGELLKGRCALITGGTSGIGFAIAEAFLRNKADIIIRFDSQMKIGEDAKFVLEYLQESSSLKICNLPLQACTAGIGNSLVVETKEKNFKDLKKFSFIICWIAGICTVCLLCLYQPFMWLTSILKASLIISAIQS